MSYKLSGINPLAYMGVEPSTPPQMVVEARSPTINDNNFNLGTYWLVGAPPPTDDWQLWILVDLTQGIATWKQLFPSGSGGTNQFDEDIGIAVPALGIINVLGGLNMNTFGSGNTILINLNNTIHWPNTTADGLSGAIYLGAVDAVGGTIFMHNYGTGNTFLGSAAGNLTLTVGSAVDNTAIGASSQTNITTGEQNTSVGNLSLTVLSTGDANCAFGAGALALAGSASSNSAFGAFALDNLTDGDDNIAIGFQAANTYTTTESNNIIIGNLGVIGDSNTIRIGTEATQTQAFMAGIYNRSVGATNAQVFIDNTGKLGTMESGQSGSVITTTFLTSGTWTKNPNTKMVEFFVWNGGPGGGSGARGNSGAASGGGGGAGGNVAYYKCPAQFCDTTEPITIGAGGSGGASVTTDNTQGNDGALGGPSGVGDIIYSQSIYSGIVATTLNAFGFGGTLTGVDSRTNAAGGVNSIVWDSFSQPVIGCPGGNGSVAAGYPAPQNATRTQPAGTPLNMLGTFFNPSFPTNPVIMNGFMTPGGGGGGAGCDTGTPRAGGSAAPAWNPINISIIFNGAVGGNADNPGAPGLPQPSSGCIFIGGGGGGGGGGYFAGGGTYNGGVGHVPGGGGGGGGGTLNGTNSGAGGNGGAGMVLIFEYL